MDRQQTRADPAIERPVFIVGAPRSGTSLLYRLLQRHPTLRPKTENLEEANVFEHLWRPLAVRSGRPASMYKFMLEDEHEYSEFLRATRFFRMRATALLAPNFFLRRRATWWWRHVVNTDHFLQTFFYYAKRARACEVVVEKTPGNWRYLRVLNGAFPSARFLYIARHPVDQFTSYRRRADVDAAAEWANIRVEQFCSEYRRSAEAVLSARADGLPLMLLRYEALTTDPTTVLGTIWRFLGVAPSSEPLEGLEEPHVTWSPDPYLYREVVQTTKNWRDFATPELARRIEMELQDVMTRLGYQAKTRMR